MKRLNWPLVIQTHPRKFIVNCTSLRIQSIAPTRSVERASRSCAHASSSIQQILIKIQQNQQNQQNESSQIQKRDVDFL